MIQTASNDSVFVIGSGGHAKVVIDVLLQNDYKIKGVLDDNRERIGQQICDIDVIATTDYLNKIKTPIAIIAIGDNKTRKSISQRFNHVKWVTVIHPRAFVHSSAHIGFGTIICAGAIVQPGVRLNNHIIVNTGATVDHDCFIGSFAHIAPGANLAGSVNVAEGAFMGIGSKIIPDIQIGEWSIVGAGATVITPVSSNLVVVGTPARPIGKN